MKTRSLLIAVFALALPFLLSLACGSPSLPEIGAVVTAKSLDADYKPVDSTTTYQAEDTFYVSVEVKNLVVGSVVEVQYKTDGELYESSTLTADKAGSGYYGFSLKPGEFGHQPGTYTAEVYLDGTLAKTVTFTVEGGQAGIVDVVICKSLDADYKPVDPTTTFGPMDVISTSVAVSNVKAGSEIKVVYTFNGEAMENATTINNSGSGYYGFTLSPSDTGHPAGEYTVEVYLDGEMFGSPLTFTVTP